MEVVNANPYGINIIGRQQTSGETDYVQDGTLNRGANAPSVMVTSADDLEDLTEIYTPGTVAYTAGFKAMWQLNAAGEWVSMM